MNPFLCQVAKVYLENESANLTDYTFVFPNKRSGTFFLNYLLELAPNSIIAPRILTISDFISEYSSGIECTRMELSFILYDEYKKLIFNISPESQVLEFDKFQFWADMLLTDFSDVDKYLVDARQLFRNVKNLKEINSNFLTDEQIEAIKQYWGESKLPERGDSFWKHIKHSDDEQLTLKFIKLWEILYELYVAFRARLTQSGLCYSGMSYREVAENFDFRTIANASSARFIFIGFNVLSKSEIVIFEKLKSLDIADFYWDYNSPAYSYVDNRATRFVGRYVTQFKSRYAIDEQKIEHFPNINVIGVPSCIGQIKETTNIIGKLNAQKKISEKNTAIVLPDEGLFIPLLHSLPDSIDTVNITMGFPMRHSSVSTFMSLVISMQLRARVVHEQMHFFYEDIVTLLSHGLIKTIAYNDSQAIVKHINENRAFNLSAKYICENYPSLSKVFVAVKDLNSVDEVNKYVRDLLQWIKANIDKKSSDYLFIGRYLDLLDRFEVLVKKYDIQMSESTIFHLLERIIGSASVNFKGEPLKGLQIMGVLETRTLDFENLIILSMNERVFPRKHYTKTFIPNTLRKGYGMSTISFQESMYAYYFYRMISRAKNVYIMYDSRANGLQSGEMSRYLYQLKYLYPRDNIKFTAIKYPVLPVKKIDVKVEKSPDIMGKLNLYKDFNSGKNLSASALKNYIKCPLLFYLQNVEGYDYVEDEPEFMDDRTFGTIMHEVAEKFYKGLKGCADRVLITEDTLDKQKELRGNIMKQITRSINYYYKKLGKDNDTPLQGDAQVLGEIMLRFTLLMFENEKQFADFYFVDAEKKISQPWKINDKHTINFTMLIDRVDEIKIDDTSCLLRFVDYKTGSDEVSISNIGQLFNPENKKKSEAIFQLLVYCFFYAHAENYDKDIQPYIYPIRSINITHLPPITINKETITSYKQCAEEFWALFEKMIDEIFDERQPFLPTPNEERCKICNFLDICNKKIKGN